MMLMMMKATIGQRPVRQRGRAVSVASALIATTTGVAAKVVGKGLGECGVITGPRSSWAWTCVVSKLPASSRGEQRCRRHRRRNVLSALTLLVKSRKKSQFKKGARATPRPHKSCEIHTRFGFRPIVATTAF